MLAATTDHHHHHHHQMIWFTLLLLIFDPFVPTTAVDFTNCGLYQIDNLEIDGCEDDGSTCYLIIGSNTSISFDVTSAHSSNSFASEVYFAIRGQRFLIAATPADPCTVLVCPVAENFKTHYTATLHINDTFVPFQAELNWLNFDDSSRQAICITVDVVLNYASTTL